MMRRIALAVLDRLLSVLVVLGIAEDEENREGMRSVNGRPLRHKQVWRHRDVIDAVERLGLPKDTAILEVGCGPGWFVQALHELGYGHVRACDWLAPEALEPDVRAAVDYQRVDLNREGLSAYGDGAFGLVISSNVIEHLESPAFIFREIGRVLAPGGVAVISLPNAFNLVERLHLLFTGNSSRYPEEPTTQSFGHISKLPTRVIGSLARRAGLVVVGEEPGYCYYRGKFLFAGRRFGHLWSYNATYTFRKDQAAGM